MNTSPTENVIHGFTLIELLISISVFVFLTTFTVFGFRGAGYANNLRQAAQEMIANVRRAQTLTQSAATASTGAVPAGGFGITSSPSSDDTRYSLFADLDGSNTFSASDVRVVSEDITLRDNTYIVSQSLDPADTATKLYVLFTPPRGSVEVEWYKETDSSYHIAKGSVLTVTYCLGHKQLTNVFRKITVIPATGQIQEQGATSCT